jgi:hypothetical protein
MPPRVGDIPRIKSQNPISLREVSRASAASGEKITLLEAPVGVPGSSRVAATNLAVSSARNHLPRARNPKGHRFRCRVPEFWPDYLSPSLRRSTASTGHVPKPESTSTNGGDPATCEQHNGHITPSHHRIARCARHSTAHEQTPSTYNPTGHQVSTAAPCHW